jgi:hypothetical protein
VSTVDAGRLDRPAPTAELRTSLALATLGAGLVHLMTAVHDGGTVLFAVAALQAALAALVAFTASRTVLGPAIAFNVVITLGATTLSLPGLLAALLQLVAAGGALALLRGSAAGRWSRFAFAAFALAALTGFGHFGH